MDAAGTAISPSAHRGARKALLEATEALLLEGGPEQVSIRAVVKRSGFSAPTIYHHFGDKDGLIDAVLELRVAEQLKGMTQVPRYSDPLKYLRELTSSYIKFGLQNPSHYRLMSSPRPGSKPLPSAIEIRMLYIAALTEAAPRAADLNGLFELCWAVLHGIVSVQIQRPGFEFNTRLVDMGLDMLESEVRRVDAAGALV